MTNTILFPYKHSGLIYVSYYEEQFYELYSNVEHISTDCSEKLSRLHLSL